MQQVSAFHNNNGGNHTGGNSPTDKQLNSNGGDHQLFSNSSDRRAPIKAFPTPSNAIGNILGFNKNAFLDGEGQQSPKATHLEGE